jgi:RNA polymerase sigma-70 factor, ECF subfamily
VAAADSTVIKADEGPSNDELVCRCATGDSAAEAAIMARFAFGVRVMVRRRMQCDHADLDDLVQEVFVAVLKALRQGQILNGAALPGYVQTAATRRADRWIGERAEARALHQTLDPDDERLAAPGNPVISLDLAARARCVRELLSELPTPRDRAVLQQFYVEDQNEAEICARVGIHPSHFRRVIHRARGRFRELVQRHGLNSSIE